MKKLYILIGIFVIILIILMMSMVLRKKSISENGTPTPTPSVTSLLTVVKTIPRNNEKDVSTDVSIIIEFNRAITEDDFKFGISPDTPYTTSIDGSAITIIPISTWDEGTPYRFNIRYPAQLSQGFNFITEGDPIETLPDTRPDQESIDQEENFTRETRPDVYLANKMPYSENSFSVITDYKSAPEGHFFFIVEPVEGFSLDEVTSDFKSWVFSTGVTEGQYFQLDITYLEPVEQTRRL